jgi:hypothetical protein
MASKAPRNARIKVRDTEYYAIKFQRRKISDGDEDSDVFGVTDFFSKTICISKNLSHRQLISTVVHEVLHAVHPDLKESAIIHAETAVVDALYQTGLLDG